MKRFDSLKGWLDWQENLHPIAIDLGLERVTKVYNALNPDRIKPITITVAGTNGKGSCVAYLEAIYRAQGYRVGKESKLLQIDPTDARSLLGWDCPTDLKDVIRMTGQWYKAQSENANMYEYSKQILQSRYGI